MKATPHDTRTRSSAEPRNVYRSTLDTHRRARRRNIAVGDGNITHCLNLQFDR